MILSIHVAKSMGLHTSFISADMERHVHILICYTYCYILDLLFSDNWIASVHMFIFLWLDVFLLLQGYPDTVYVMTVPCPLTEPVIIVHPVNRILFYFVDACFFSFLFFSCIYWCISLMPLEAVAKCVSFNPTGTHTKPCVHASFLYIYCL